MEEIFETIRPIISGLLGAICVYFIVGFTTESAKTSNGRKILEYGLPVKILTTILIFFSIFVVYAASQARESQIVIASIIAGCFLLGAIFFGYQVFLLSSVMTVTLYIISRHSVGVKKYLAPLYFISVIPLCYKPTT